MLLGSAALGALLLAALGWLLGTTSGLRFVLARAEQATGGSLVVQHAEGRFWGPVQLSGLRYHHADGLAVSAARIDFQLRLRDLLRARVHLLRLDARKIVVTLPTRPGTHGNGPPRLRAPVDLAVQHAQIRDLRVQRAGKLLFEATRIALSADWTHRALRVRQFDLQAPQGSVALKGNLGWGTGLPGRLEGRVHWKTASRHWAGTLVAHSDGRKLQATLVTRLPAPATLKITASTHGMLTWTAALDLPSGLARAWLGGTRPGTLAATLEAHGDADQAWAKGSVRFGNRSVRIQALHVRRDTRHPDTLQLAKLLLDEPGRPGTLSAHGTVNFRGAGPEASLHVEAREIELPSRNAGQRLAVDGTLDLQGSLARYHAVLAAQTAGKAPQATLHARLEGSATGLTVASLDLQQAQGKLTARGKLIWKPALKLHLSVQGSRLDPGLWLPGWQGALDTKLTLDWTDAHGEPSARLGLDALSGTLRGKPLSGKGTLELSARRVLSGRMALDWGSDRIRIAAAAGPSNRIDLAARIDRLAAWLPGAHGSVNLDAHLRGAWNHLKTRGRVDARRLAWKTAHVGSLKARFDLADPTRPSGSLQLEASDLQGAGFAFRKLSVDGRGNRLRQHWRLRAEGDPLSLDLQLEASQHGRSWRGTLNAVQVRLAGQPAWTLEKPAAWSLRRSAFALASTCLHASGAQLCVQARRLRDGGLDARYRLHELPLEGVLAFTANDLPLRARGLLDGEGRILADARGQLTGKATLRSAEGRVFYVDRPDQPLLRYHALHAVLSLAPGSRALRLHADLQRKGMLDADLHLTGPGDRLDGSLQLALDNLQFIELFTSEVANPKGSAKVDLKLAGTLARPQFAGQALVNGLAMEVPSLGLKLDHGRLRLTPTASSGLAVSGQVRSGKGLLHVDGQLRWDHGLHTDLRLEGKQVTVAHLPAASVTLSPDVTIRIAQRSVALGGALHVDSAVLQLEKLPGAGATQASPDVVVVDAPAQPTSAKPPLAVRADLRVDLGPDTQVSGYGLKGTLQGALQVTARPGQATTGQGQIRIDGSFHVYGQDLGIKRGLLLYAASPLDDPGLDIRAVRKLNPNLTVSDGQEVGIAITGTAHHPQTSVFSDPAMDSSDALAYLITGKPLSQVDAAQGSMINSATQALGSLTGNLLARKIGTRLGIEDIGVSSNQALGTTAFTVGKYLSPRLYVSYGVGLFQPGQVVTLRYILSRRWNFEAQQSTDASRASFNYRYEH